MGDEAICNVRLGGRRSRGKALLETTELIFRGPPRVIIPFGEIAAVAARDGELTVRWRDDDAVFELGARAERWAEKIRKPKSTLEKLGVTRGMRISLLGVFDQAFVTALRTRDVALVEGRAAAKSQIVFFACTHRQQLSQLTRLKKSLEPAGAIWVVRPKGSPDIHERDVLAAGRAAGFVDTKVVAFSPTHSAAKLMIPVAQR